MSLSYCSISIVPRVQYTCSQSIIFSRYKITYSDVYPVRLFRTFVFTMSNMARKRNTIVASFPRDIDLPFLFAGQRDKQKKSVHLTVTQTFLAMLACVQIFRFTSGVPKAGDYAAMYRETFSVIWVQTIIYGNDGTVIELNLFKNVSSDHTWQLSTYCLTEYRAIGKDGQHSRFRKTEKF